MELHIKDEKGKELFLGMKYWMYFSGWIGICIGSIHTVFLVWMTYLNINEIDINPKLHWMFEWFYGLVPVDIVIVSIGLLLMMMGCAHYVYYYVKTASRLVIKFSLQSDLRSIYIEMEQVAKEKKWI